MPNWLAGWIRVNNKHVVHGIGESASREKKGAQTATTRSTATLDVNCTTGRRRSWNAGRNKAEIRQILSEAAFMAEPDVSAPPTRDTPEGLVVTTEKRTENKASHFRGLAAAIFANEQDHCANCTALEQKLENVSKDLEYMRGVALKQGCHADGCACASCKPLSKHTAVAGKEFHDLVQNHKRIVDALSTERATYQEHVEQELLNYENLCQNLTHEAACQKQKAESTLEELDKVKWERDELSIENLRLQAQVVGHAKQQAEYSILKRRYMEYEEHGIKSAEEQIGARDRLIEDLSSKLERALDVLERERGAQHQQRAEHERRQIIFPPKAN